MRAGGTILDAVEHHARTTGGGPRFDPAALCRTGGCWNCAVTVDGEVRRGCLTSLHKGMRISTAELPPRRIISGFQGHQVGGVGTPWDAKQGCGYIEVACFGAGCNFRCPQCQNWPTTYAKDDPPMSPAEAAERLTETRRSCGVDRMAISGGESTLNRRWLVAYLHELRARNSDRSARLHVDTNGSLLTAAYLDELVDAGMTDIGIDLKANRGNTFQTITGVVEPAVAQRYMETAWEAVRYLVASHPGVFVGVGIPYNEALTSVEEIEVMGRRIASISPKLQVTVLDYRPEFAAMHLHRPTAAEMKRMRAVLLACGLRNVICQTTMGHIGPERCHVE